MNKRKISFLIFNISFLIILLLFNVFLKRADIIKGIPLKDRFYIKAFGNDTTIREEFIADDNYDYYNITFATFAYVHKDGDVELLLNNLDTGEKCKKVIHADAFDDYGSNNFYCKLNKNDHYSLDINTNGINDNHKLTIYTTEYDDDNYKLSINGKEQKNNLMINFGKRKKSNIFITYLLLLIPLNLLLYYYNKDEVKHGK